MSKTLLLGERWNDRWGGRKPRAPHVYEHLRREWDVHHMLFCSPADWYLKKLVDKLGVRWDEKANLLWPSPTAGEWDTAKARDAWTDRLYPWLRENGYGTVLSLGVRVAAATGVKRPFVGLVEDVDPATRVVVLPHPSGRCRFWNDSINVEVLRDELGETLR